MIAHSDIPLMAACSGEWQRTGLVVNGTPVASRAEVRWIQGPTRFVDLRVDPTGAEPLDGFAGTLRQTGDVFTWHRTIELSESELPDEGFMSLIDGVLHERGVHADYSERWERQPTENDGSGCWAMELTSDADCAIVVCASGRLGWAHRIDGVVTIVACEPQAQSDSATDMPSRDRVGSWTITHASDQSLVGSHLTLGVSPDGLVTSTVQSAQGTNPRHESTQQWTLAFTEGTIHA
ncbi:hypothetical protein GCM10027169_02270 [Gordonia jinhuaensis]|uniref:hypothetical protein n=1 Tax=Gordonia jinhuaensis TaxID=1517702 RepID=UPI00166924ED|nr:hypothetical protein [Gordonia jinhuaensis]